MNTVLPVAVVVAYVALLTWVAVRARAARHFTEFSLAGRTLPLALVFGSLAATYVGPVFSIGFVGRGFASGLLLLGIGLAYALQNILVGLFVAPRLRRLKGCHTLGDAIGQKYDQKCQVLAGVISVGLCAGFAAVMAKAGGDVLQNIFGLPHWSSVVIVVGVTALYTTFGGLRASVITDAFQFSAFAILLPITLLWILRFHLEGGAAAFTEQASLATSAGLNSTPLIEIIALLAAFLLGETLIPPYANRALASKTTRVSQNGFILAGCFSVAWFAVMIALGIAAHGVPSAAQAIAAKAAQIEAIGAEGKSVQDFVLLILFKSTMPAAGYALLLVVLISIIMSSLDSLLNAGAVAFTQDIVKPFAKVPDSTALNIGRSATIVIALTAAAGAVAVDSIIDGLLICYAIWAPAILPALIIGLWVKRPRPLAGILSMAVGSVVAVTLWVTFKFIVHWKTETEISRIIIPALAAALLAYALGHYVEKTKSGP
ncbi:MAG: sodium:solute symporter family protein [Planctomycetes bacterium]|nr:sodium:solute symporter family protein [Planctomycetota bacterium]